MLKMALYGTGQLHKCASILYLPNGNSTCCASWKPIKAGAIGVRVPRLDVQEYASWLAAGSDLHGIRDTSFFGKAHQWYQSAKLADLQRFESCQRVIKTQQKNT